MTRVCADIAQSCKRPGRQNQTHADRPSQLTNCAKTPVVMPLAASSASTATQPFGHLLHRPAPWGHMPLEPVAVYVNDSGQHAVAAEVHGFALPACVSPKSAHRAKRDNGCCADPVRDAARQPPTKSICSIAVPDDAIRVRTVLSGPALHQPN